MKWFTNRRIFTKIICCFVIVAAVSGLVSYMGILQIKTLSQSMTAIYEEQALPIAQTSTMLSTFYQMNVDARDMIFATDADVMHEHLANVHIGISQINVLASDFLKLDLTAEIEEAFDLFIASRAAYNKSLETLYVYTRDNRDEEAKVLLYGEMQISTNGQAEALRNLMQLALQDAEKKVAVNTERAEAIIQQMMIWLIVAAILALVLGIFISSIISRPIHKLVRAANSLADGNLDITIDIQTKDEVGMLARAFVKMTDNMNYALANIWTAAEQVASGSKQVADSSTELSHGATEQASSIEECTASLEEVSAQTKQNAVNADKANTIAENAKANASQGNTQMHDLLIAMEEINESSNNISKVIKVIDEIAFQTNILALNAAIEAARAGQYGKGFAVVAEEVRNLAARSANAAKETTDMIESSKKKASDGMYIARQTADALNKIVVSIAEVADIVGDIAVASNEQASAIGQINEGVMLVSDVTQSNSATSEEGAAASEQLSGQAELLKIQVARFTLKNSQQAVNPSFKELNSVQSANVTEGTSAKSGINVLQKTKDMAANLKRSRVDVAKSEITHNDARKADNELKLKEQAENIVDKAQQEAAATRVTTINLDDDEFGKY